MILAAFVISSVVVLVALALIAGAQRTLAEKARVSLQNEVAGFLEQAEATDADHASGVFDGMKVDITLGHHEIGYTVELPTAVLRYSELLARFGTDGLRHQLYELSLTLEPAAGTSPKVKDRLVGTVPREPSLPENLVTIANRLSVAQRVRELRAHAPSALLDRLVDAHSAYDVDQILIQLTQHFPDAPETEEAIELAAEREHGHPDRVRSRAQQWLTRSPA